MKLYNTLSKQIEDLQPLQAPRVTIYTCGPTVYDYPHIGNWFTFVRYDLLVRALTLDGLQPDWVMNITDVGHLVSDADEGEDKLEKGARREGKTAWDVAKFYSDYFVRGLERLNITTPSHLPKATDHIQEQIDLIKVLEDKGYTYVIDDGVYFDTAKFPQYGDFAQLDLDEQQAGKRVEFNAQKRNGSDFALWKFSPAGQQRDMEWDSPWAPAGEQEHRGFPGWHVECSAMSMKYLGETIDVHSGGIDHIPVHHTNEIAQSEGATGKRFAHYWMHANHITIEGEKISKSLGNGITLEDIESRGYSLDVLRLHILESHYRSQSKFSWESLDASKNRLTRWYAMADRYWQVQEVTQEDGTTSISQSLHKANDAILNDLDTPAAMSAIDEAMGIVEKNGVSDSSQQVFRELLDFISQTLGITLLGDDIDNAQRNLIAERVAAREQKDWAASDTLRDDLLGQNIAVKDTPQGTLWARLR